MTETNQTTTPNPTADKPKYDFPTEVIDLPSRGLVYPKDHPLSKGTVEIKYMTAREEDILSNQNLIKKGVAINKLFEAIIVDNIDVNDIVIGDKNAIILATRLLAYGADYPMKFYSTVADDVLEAKVDLSKIQIKDIDYEQLNNENRFEFETPIGKNKLEFKLLTHGDEIAIEKDLNALQKVDKDSAAGITTRMRYMILSVDGKNDVGTINRYVNNMLARDSRAFREYARKLSPDLDMNFVYVHPDGDEEVVPILLGVNFFWPSEES